MTPLVQAIEVCQAAINAIVLWLVWHCLWRRACQERLRQNLFELRDKLFDYARSGSIPFTNRAYVMLRANINSMIRFSHLISVTRVFTFICFQRYIGQMPGEQFQLGFRAALAEIEDASTKTTLEQLHERMYALTFKHLVCVSPHLLLLAPFLVALDRTIAKRDVRCYIPPGERRDATVALIELQANEAFKSEAIKRRKEQELVSA